MDTGQHPILTEHEGQSGGFGLHSIAVLATSGCSRSLDRHVLDVNTKNGDVLRNFMRMSLNNI